MMELRTGDIEPITANSIAGQSREICRIANLHLNAAKLTGNKKFITNVRQLLG